MPIIFGPVKLDYVITPQTARFYALAKRNLNSIDLDDEEHNRKAMQEVVMGDQSGLGFFLHASTRFLLSLLVFYCVL